MRRSTSEDAADLYGTIVSGGPPVSITFTTPAQRARLVFEGTAGQRVSLIGAATNVSASNGAAILWNPLAIVKPDGTHLVAVSTDGNALLEPVGLPVSGVYTVLLDLHSTSTGTATVQVYDVVDVTGALTINGGAVAVPLAEPGQNGVLTFAGTAGDRVTVRLTGHTIGRCSDSCSENSANQAAGSSDVHIGIVINFTSS